MATGQGHTEPGCGLAPASDAAFVRQAADTRHRQVPGARWLKADLHTHTLDDRSGGRVGLPSNCQGEATDPAFVRRYARCFLQGAIAQGVQVLGLTPHSPRIQGDLSAVWEIVDTWNHEDDEDGVPFREKLYAVFPGFEPNVREGQSGVHLLFLFDPEIGRQAFLQLFDAVMNGASAWDNSSLRLTSRGIGEILECIDQRRNQRGAWNYLVLAPHFQGEHGLLREVHKQVLQSFPADRIAAYELGDSVLPGDLSRDTKPGSFLLPFMEEHRQSFFHGSDAYSVDTLGQRYTWLKLASPRIEALRQAFLAGDSRLRIAFERGADGRLRPLSQPPDVTICQRPWLKSVVIQGGASFFGGTEQGQPRETRLEFSPDLTCVIGGSMTGKSTLLDGLRVYTGAPLPQDPRPKKQVEDRAQNRFLPGSPEIVLDCPGSDPTAPLSQRWNALFFAQNELQRLSQDSEAVERILAGLVASESEGIGKIRRQLEALDQECARLADELTGLEQQVGEAEQAFNRVSEARQALEAFSDAGVNELHGAARDQRAWTDSREKAAGLGQDLGRLIEASQLEFFELSDPVADLRPKAEAVRAKWAEFLEQLQASSRCLQDWLDEARETEEELGARLREVQARCEQALVARGLDASKLREFQSLSRQAALFSSYQANLAEVRQGLARDEGLFASRLEEREQLVGQLRAAYDRVAESIEQDFGGRIRSCRIDCGNTDTLDAFLRGLGERGITRWWNERQGKRALSPARLLGSLEASTLGQVGMSSAVQETFREVMTRARRRQLAALRCPDTYRLELRLEDGSHRPLDELSGGQRVSVLLSLLLETADERPLVIDQPEDELDNRFLFETVLPTLKKLKGRRQVIVATHSANIVVNGDADQVVQLEATASQARVACSGAIEEPEVREAILQTVDGGNEAFRLRRLKYGY